MARSDYLFNSMDWFNFQAQRMHAAMEEIDSLGGNQLLNSSAADLSNYFVQKFTFDVPNLQEDHIEADQREGVVEVHDPFGMRHDRGRVINVVGTIVEVVVPFAGDRLAFQIQPSRYTTMPPRGRVDGDKLVLSVSGVDLNPQGVRSDVDRSIKEIKDYLGWLRENAEKFNRELAVNVERRLDARRTKLLKDQNLVANLGFPMRARSDVPRTFAAPEVRRRIAPTMPKSSNAPFKPEPTLGMADYEHILEVMSNMAVVMERSPSAFSSMDEEALRSHFLVQLNGHYEGQATGETFNYDGKTDILIRANGRNIFIAECKYWSGPKKLESTVDQLLGYTSWRDTKVAIVIFNRNKNFTQVLEAIAPVMTGHANFKKELPRPSETSFRYIYGHRDDANRELTLTVQVFDVPHGKAS